MTAPLQIAVVGHTNAGKTSLLRTLTRRIDFGEVSDRPGTTRHVEAVDLRVDGRAAVRLHDTPGLEDSVALLAHLRELPGAEALSRPQRVRRFLDGPEAHGVFEQEAKVLRQMLAADAAFVVIDTREPVLPKYRDEIELINSCAKPVLPVLNFVGAPAHREAEWRAALSDAGLHAVVRFDAAAPFTGAERDLYQDLGTLLPERRAALGAIAAHLAREAAARRAAGCRQVAGLLVGLAALHRALPVDEAADAARRAAHAERLARDVARRAQAGAEALLALHGFRTGDAAEAPLPLLQGRGAGDLFSTESLRQAGVRLGQGAAVGAAVGAAADIASAGLSLGTGMAIGGALGGALAQGFGPFGRRLAQRARGLAEIGVEDGVLVAVAQRQLALLAALERRGHAASAPLAPAVDIPALDATALRRALRPARSHPEWEGPAQADRPARTAAEGRVATLLSAALPAMAGVPADTGAAAR